MLVGVIQEKTIGAVAQRLAALPPVFDMVELRLDALEAFRVQDVASLVLPCPALFTLRPKGQGGAFAGSEAERLEGLLALAGLAPAYIDVEYDTPPEWIARIATASPGTQLVLSCHDFTRTPEDLAALLAPMRAAAPGAWYKIATMGHSTLDALRMLVFCKECPDPLIGIVMGEDGATTRVLAPVVGPGFSYCPVTEASAPGQIDATTLAEVYNFKALNKQTKIYGLLGDPVSKSVGHLFHNRLNRETGENAVYVKWRLEPEELPEAVALLRRLGVAGLSVTMPLKEHMMPLVESHDGAVHAIGALNTVVAEGDLWHGHNTDGPGALQALHIPLAGKRVAVLGAGGAAKAVIFAASQAGAELLVLNRSVAKAAALGVQALPLEALETLAERQCHVVINALPVQVALPLSPRSFMPGSVAMDITYMGGSVFLEAASLAGCKCLEGTGMFQQQALLQRRIWGLGCS